MGRRIRELNGTLRILAIICGIIWLLSQTTDKEVNREKHTMHGYQSEEFDDIW